ncbi:MAG TPA: nucleotidyltransferase family protein [Gemmataceae bacterium]|nr:nucleotidyltransferase family protein [Gemmataceae bacterium]
MTGKSLTVGAEKCGKVASFHTTHSPFTTHHSPVTTMTAAILAGGLGTRLRSVVVDRPKVLATVQGKPFLLHLLDRLAEAGIGKTVLLTGYRADQVLQAVGHNHRGMTLIHSVEPRPLGTGGALRNALKELSSASVLLLNGDSWCDVDLTDFCDFHHELDADVSMVLTRVNDAARFGAVTIGPGCEVERFEQKEADGSAWINAGIYLIARRLIEDVPGGPASLERDLLPRWLGQGNTVFGYCHSGPFVDIGTPESYADADWMLDI